MNRSQFKYFSAFKVRWEDVDQYGHVNNIKFYSYVDTAINEFQVEVGQWQPLHSPVRFYAVTNECHFHRSILFRQALSVGVAIEKMGNSSVIFNTAIFIGEQPAPAATCRSVMVTVDAKSEQSVPLPEQQRKAYAPYVLESV